MSDSGYVMFSSGVHGKTGCSKHIMKKGDTFVLEGTLVFRANCYDGRNFTQPVVESSQ